jgi:hypothetical protein
LFIAEIKAETNDLTLELARPALQDLTRPLELPEDGRGKRVERDTTAASREREAIVRVIHLRPRRILAGWILAVSSRPR